MSTDNAAVAGCWTMGSKREGERAGKHVVQVCGELLLHRLGKGEKLAAWRIGATKRYE